MDQTSSFPKQDFEGMVLEIWSGLDICLYHAVCRLDRDAFRG
jgi:hypothetical protein